VTKVDCSKAGAMMSDASKMGRAATSTGDQEKDYLATMMNHEQGTILLMQVEAACGKDPKIKAMAQKGIDGERSGSLSASGALGCFARSSRRRRCRP
jgi:uncharacterized protein (DUF305 family)